MFTRMKTIALVCGCLGFAGCAGAACGYDSNGYIIDYYGCLAYRAERESQAYDESRAKEQARKGSSYAKYSLGKTFETGGMVSINEPDGQWRGATADLKKNKRQAIYWYKEAIRQGGSGADKAREALIRLGKKPPETPASQLSVLGYEAYENGNDKKAAEYWLEAAQRGDAMAQNNIGWAYDTGRGVEQNYFEAVRWYRLAAAQGNQRAQSSLAEIYLFGLPGIPIDRAEGARYSKMAAEQGDPVAQKNLGFLYKEGEVLPQSDVEAVRWFRAAAASDHAPAYFSLGLMYEEGRGVPRSLSTAIEWYRKGAANREERAQRALQRLGVGS